MHQLGKSDAQVPDRCGAALPSWLIDRLGVAATAGMSVLDWLLIPQQQLLGVVAGAVYADDSGALSEPRRDPPGLASTRFGVEKDTT